jgi:hypothetical protein
MIPPGAILIYAKGQTPEGWLPCDGTCYHRSLSEPLFEQYRGLTSLPGDPPDSFRTPNATPFVPKVIVQFIIKT